MSRLPRPRRAEQPLSAARLLSPARRTEPRTEPRTQSRTESRTRPAQSFGGGDLVPLSQRITVLSAVRAVICLSLLLAAGVDGSLHRAVDVAGPLGYLLAASLASAAILLITHRPTAVGGLGLVLCLDSLALQWVQHRAGPDLPVDLAIAIFLVSVCLLASFRTGLKLVIWQSLLIGLDDQGGQNGLFDTSPGRSPHRAVTELILLWALVLVVCLAASISERELRRRRHDAETVQAFATALHRDDDPRLVLGRTVRFVVDELDARRVLVCSRPGGRLTVLAGHGLDDAAARSTATVQAAGDPSGLLPLAERPGEPALLLALDRIRDPWLSALLPDAQRLVVLPLGPDGRGDPLWLIFEHGAGDGARVERRVLATAGQVSATAALALSRAVLFQQAQAQAATDTLTRLPNRRAFDQRFNELAGLTSTEGFAVIIADVDRFKAVNDTYGHQVGDVVLQAVAATLAAAAPPHALVARYGGEEFAALLPGADAAEAMEVAERLRSAVAAIRDPIVVTSSFGVGVVPAGEPADEVVAAADAALYRAKEAGRNAVMLGDLSEVTRSGS